MSAGVLLFVEVAMLEAAVDFFGECCTLVDLLSMMTFSTVLLMLVEMRLIVVCV